MSFLTKYATKLLSFTKGKKGISGIIYVTIGIVILVVSTLIVNAVIVNAAFTGINNTVATYVTTFMLLGALVLGASVAINYLRGKGE